jgi:TRAP-type C4-dicarboxylate transport system permease small subunit
MLRSVVLGLAVLAAASLLIMMSVTVVDVVLRVFGLPLTGAYDLVKLAGTFTLAGALPYTTAVKGHVAIEFLSQRFRRRTRAVVDGALRLGTISLFSLLAWSCFEHGNSLRHRGQVSMTLQLPEFWAAYAISASCSLVVLVTLFHLFHPDRELIPS